MAFARSLLITCALGALAGSAVAQEEPPPAPRIHHGPISVRPSTFPPAASTELTSPALLPRPFTAAQICAELTEGLVITWRITSALGVKLQRWTVLGSTQEDVTIEYATLDEAGSVLGEPTFRTTTCAELRSHATYPIDRATRDELQGVESPLGPLDGWLYRLREKEEGLVSGFFFSSQHPGPPIFARTVHGDTLVSEMVQIGRGGVPAPSSEKP